MAALATQTDVETALKVIAPDRTLTADEIAALDALIGEATDLVVGYLHPSSVPTPTPPAITRVVASMVAVALTRPKGMLPETTQLTADVFSASFAPGATSPGLYLTHSMKQRLAPYRTGMVSQLMSSELGD